MSTEGPGRDRSSLERFQRRAAAAEINGRQVNEAIEPRGQGEESAVFVCECGHLGCSETVEIPIVEYESVRTDFDRFLVVPGHEIEHPLAVVILGGLVTSTALNLFLLPPLYAAFGRSRAAVAAAREDAARADGARVPAPGAAK